MDVGITGTLYFLPKDPKAYSVKEAELFVRGMLTSVWGEPRVRIVGMVVKTEPVYDVSSLHPFNYLTSGLEVAFEAWVSEVSE